MAMNLKSYKDFKDKVYGLKEASNIKAAKVMYDELNQYYKGHKDHLTPTMRMAYERDLRIAKNFIQRIPKAPKLKKAKSSPLDLARKVVQKILKPKTEIKKEVSQKSPYDIDSAILDDLWLGNEPQTLTQTLPLPSTSLKKKETEQTLLQEIEKTGPVLGRLLEQNEEEIFEEIEELVDEWKHKQTQDKEKAAEEKPFQITSEKKVPTNLEYIREKITLLIEDKGLSIKTDQQAEALLIIKKDKLLMTVTSEEIKASAIINDIRDYKLMLRTAIAIYQKPLIIYIPESERFKLESAIKLIGLKKNDYKITHDQKEYQTAQEAKKQESTLESIKSLELR